MHTRRNLRIVPFLLLIGLGGMSCKSNYPLIHDTIEQGKRITIALVDGGVRSEEYLTGPDMPGADYHEILALAAKDIREIFPNAILTSSEWGAQGAFVDLKRWGDTCWPDNDNCDSIIHQATRIARESDANLVIAINPTGYYRGPHLPGIFIQKFGVYFANQQRLLEREFVGTTQVDLSHGVPRPEQAKEEALVSFQREFSELITKIARTPQ